MMSQGPGNSAQSAALPGYAAPDRSASLGQTEARKFLAGSVDVATRALRWGDLDFSVPGVLPESDLVVARRYFSDLDYDGVGSVGQDWVSTLYERVIKVSANNLRHIDWVQPYDDPAFYYQKASLGGGGGFSQQGFSLFVDYNSPDIVGRSVREDPMSTLARFTMTERNGSKRVFDSQGRVRRREDRWGNAIVFDYDSQTGFLSSVTDTVGRVFLIDTDTYGRITHFKKSDGTVLVQYVNGTGTLDEVVFPSRTVLEWDPQDEPTTTTRTTAKKYGYTAAGFLNAIKNDAGQATLTIQYDQTNPGKVSSQTSQPSGGQWTYTKNGLEVEVVNPRGFKTIYELDSVTEQVVAAREYIVNATGANPSRPVPPGHSGFYRWQFDRDTSCGCGGPITKMTEPDGGAVEVVWNADFLITELRDEENGSGTAALVHTWTYDYLGRIVSYTSPGSIYSYTVTWTAHGQNPGWMIQEITLPAMDGRTIDTVWTYTYDDKGRMRTVEFPETGGGRNLIHWEYHASGPGVDLPKKRSFGPGQENYQEFTWDDLGNLTKVQTSSGATFDATYDLEGRITLWLGPTRGANRYEHRWIYDASGNVGQARYRNLDENGTPHVLQPWIEWDWQYDLRDNLLRERRDLEHSSPTQLERAVSTWTFDSGDLPILHVDDDGIQTEVVFDERDLPWKVYAADGTSQETETIYAYSDDGNLVTEDTPVDGTNRLVYTYAYDDYDRVESMQLSDGTYALVTYDALSRVTSEGLWTDVGGNLTQVSRSESQYHDWHNQPTKILERVGDESGTLLKTITTDIEYTPSAQATKIFANGLQLGTLEYDRYGRLIKATDTLFNEELFEYDLVKGWLKKRELKHWDPVDLAHITVSHEMGYDEVGRLTSVQETGSGMPTSQIQMFYDSMDNVTRFIDQDGYESHAEYRYDGMVVASEDWVDSSGTQIRESSFQWSPAGRLRKEVDDRGKAIDYLYDDQGWLIQEMAQDGSHWDYSYTEQGQIDTLTDPQGIFIEYLRNPYGILTGRTIYQTQGGAVLERETYSYTPVGHLKRVEKRAPNNSVLSSVEFTRDSMGRPLTELQDDTYLVTYDRDSLNRLEKLTGHSGNWRQYTYDANLRVDQVFDGSGLIADYTYLGPRRLVRKRAHGNSTELEVVYDALHRVGTVKTVHPQQGVIADFNYGYDLRSLVAFEIRGHQNGRGDVYRYDGLAALTNLVKDSVDPYAEWTTPGSTVHDYERDYNLDDNQHRTSVVTTPYGLSPQSTTYVTDPIRHYYTSIGGVARQYSSNGNLEQEGNLTYTYDWADRLIQVDDNLGTLVQFTYDALGRRKEKIAGGVTTRFVYAGPWAIEEYRNGQLEAVNDYGFGSDEIIRTRRVDRADVDQDQNTTELIALYYHGNRQGSVSHLTRDDGVVVESYDYTPFGIPTLYDRQGQVVSSSPTGNRFLYTGREWDHEIQLYHYRARTYDPHYGVFLQEDPLRFDAGVNLVGYAAASPTNLTDPTGLISMRQFGSAVLDFLKEAGHELAAIGVATIPFLEEILDLLSAATGKDLTEWAEDGFRGRPDSLGFWDRIKYAAIGAAKLIGSAVGVGILRKLDKLIDYLRDCNRAKGRIGTAATNLAKRLGLKVGCFALGTLVLTPDGLVPIEEIRPGDEVVTSSPGGPDEVHRVLATPTATGTFEMVRLTIQSELGVEEIVATADHPFWSETRQRWVRAAALGLRESLRVSERGLSALVDRSTWHAGDHQQVWNLILDDVHTFRIGRSGLLVHNGCPGPSNAPKLKPGQRLGGSGRPISPTVKHSTRKRAQDAAQSQTAKGKAPVHHPAKNGNPPHYHAVDSRGELKPTHHDYPGR